MNDELTIAGHRVGRVGLGTMQLTGPGALGEYVASLRAALDGA